jgi:pilus assembly protein CpaF
MRLEQLALATAPELGLPAIRSMVALGVDVVALMGRVRKGDRVERALQAIAVLNGLDDQGGYQLRYLYQAQPEKTSVPLEKAYQFLEGQP